MDAYLDGLLKMGRKHPPVLYVVLGSGMAEVMDGMQFLWRCPFSSVPDLPKATAEGHRGELVLGELAGKVVLVSVGRLHYYEGHTWEAVVKPIELAAEIGKSRTRAIGTRVALLTNAAGGIRDDLSPGTLMPLRDHLEWNRPYPWRQPPRQSPYSKRLLDLLAPMTELAPPGVYASVTGPNYETPAEIRALRSRGADAIGMSTTREAIAGAAAGMEVAAISLVTNRAAGLSSGALSHEEVLTVGRQATACLRQVIEAFVERC